MDSFAAKLNELLNETYLNIMTLEEKGAQECSLDLSTSEFRLLQAVGLKGDKGITVGEIADAIHIARPTASVAVNKLERKGYVTKERSAEDGRSIYVQLTQRGRLADHYNRYYHRQLFTQLTSEFSEDEKEALIRGIEKLNQVFLEKFNERN